MLVCEDRVWLWWVQDMTCVVHVVQVLCLAESWWSVWNVHVHGSGRCRWWVDKTIGFGLYQSCGNRGSVGYVSVFGLRWCGVCVCGESVGGLDHGLENWGGVMFVWVRIMLIDGRSMYMYIMLGGYLLILGAPSVQSGSTLSIYASYSVFVYGRYRKSRLVNVLLSDQVLSRHHSPLWGAAPANQRVHIINIIKTCCTNKIILWHQIYPGATYLVCPDILWGNMCTCKRQWKHGYSGDQLLLQ